MNDIKDIEILKNSECTLKETSKDDHDLKNIEYMTFSEKIVINFDKVKEKYVESLSNNLSLSETPSSSDALYIADDEEMYFIEFKNGMMSKKDIFEVRLKIFDSLLTLTDIINKNVSFTRQNLSYILVYNETKNQLTEEIFAEEHKKEKFTEKEIDELWLSHLRYRFAMRLGRRSEKEYNFIRFSLRRFKNLYFKNVFTLNQKEFENQFVKKWENYAY